MNAQTKKKPTKIEEMTKEQIRQAILKKRECNARAQSIVESLLEDSVTEEYFYKCLPEINQSHLEDIIEERFILHLCGYPLCSKPINEDDIPKQKYKISMKTNKIYDITARKNFCSNPCYKSAMHIKKQMLTSPLWFREYEVIPNFHLLPRDSIGSLGEEIDISLIEKVKTTDKNTSFISINDFAKANLQEMTESNCDKSTPKISQNNSSHKIEVQKMLKPIDENLNSEFKENKCEIIENSAKRLSDQSNASIVEPQHSKSLSFESVKSPEKVFKNLNSEDSGTKLNLNNKVSNKTFQQCSNNKLISKNSKKNIKNPMNIVGEVIERSQPNIDHIITKIPEPIESKKKIAKKVIKTKKQPAIVLITKQVEESLAEWFTLDTLLFLFGEDKVKEMVSDKGQCIQDYLNNYAKSIFYTSNTYDQYQQLCKRLNMLELEDRKFDSQTLQRESKPLPDYSILKEESKKLQLKVRAYYSGETEIEETINDTEEFNADSKEDSAFTQVPLVDKNAQNALRRRIVCQHLNKALPDLLRSLGLLTLSISSEVRLLVNTFKLKAENIMFKPIQWTLITIVIIKLLSFKDGQLRYLLQQPLAYQHLQLLLLSFNQDGGYLERLVSWLTDVDRLLKVDDTQLTM